MTRTLSDLRDHQAFGLLQKGDDLMPANGREVVQHGRLVVRQQPDFRVAADAEASCSLDAKLDQCRGQRLLEIAIAVEAARFHEPAGFASRREGVGIHDGEQLADVGCILWAVSIVARQDFEREQMRGGGHWDRQTGKHFERFRVRADFRFNAGGGKEHIHEQFQRERLWRQQPHGG